MILCPQCESHNVRRVPSAVAIGGNPPEKASTASTPASTAMLPAGQQAMALYRQLVGTLINSCEDVGSSFAEEARKIHYAEAPERAIRGHATHEECEALADEGIAVMRLPDVKDEH